MPSQDGWYSLQSSDNEIPRILLKSAFSKEGYDVQLTDLSRIWSQRLSKEDIVTQARRYRCSIDPSEDDEQYRILQDKIRSALSQDAGTSLSLSLTNDAKLELQVTAPLPSPLPELEWTLSLSWAPAEDVSASLIQPLLHQASSLQTQMKQLIAELQAKDKVIAKITDRLETSGHDLTAVFPGVSNVKLSRKKTQQEQLARHVVGLGRFDEGAWRERIEKGASGEGHALTEDLLDGVLGGLPRASSVDLGKADWWRKLEGRKVDLGGSAAGNRDDSKHAVDSARENQGIDVNFKREVDEFQRQATPPGLKLNAIASTSAPDAKGDAMDLDAKEDEEEDEDDLDAPSQPARRSQRSQQSQPAVSASADKPVASKEAPSPGGVAEKQPLAEDNDDEETEDEDDLDAVPKPTSRRSIPRQPSPPIKHASPSPAAAASPAPRKKLGAIGGKNKKPSPSPSPAPATAKGDERSSGSPTAPPQSKGKLGTIGGKAKRSKSPELPTSPAATSPAPDRSSAKPMTKKLGILGGKRTNSATQQIPAASAEPPSSPGPQILEPNDKAERASGAPKREVESEPTVRETSEERANKKREALKRDLEEKAKQPVKKKRKF